MTLRNLQRIGQLKEHRSVPAEIHRLLSAASRSLADSRVDAISLESRFDAAYRSIMQAALAALMANEYRPNTNKPGHHVTVLQTLPVTIGLSGDRLVVLDALRRKRNLTDYAGMPIDENSASECSDQAEFLLARVRMWIGRNRADLLRE